jgi:hypothetical protein
MKKGISKPGEYGMKEEVLGNIRISSLKYLFSLLPLTTDIQTTLPCCFEKRWSSSLSRYHR